jgi:DNA polymerase V
MKVTEIYELEQRTRLELPLFLVRVPAGFPSPGDGQIERKLDLNELIRHPEATFLVKVEGDSMINAGINSGDILVVDRAIEPTHNKIVVAYLNGELTVKRLKIENTKIYLVAENPDYNPIRITPLMDFEIRGVVTTVIHKL